MVPVLSWSEKLKRYRKGKTDHYARAVIEEPQKSRLYSVMRFPGVVMIMGDIRAGKTGLAHYIAEEYHSRKGIDAVLHLPRATPARRRQIKKLVPEWMKVTSLRSQWSKNAVVIYDEAAQSAHSRRSQSGDAIELDDLLAISGQRKQLILFISHHSRKLDLNICTALHRIIWKRPTYAHQLWERNELTDFTMKAYDFFRGIKGEVAKKKACLLLDMDEFVFYQCTNSLPSWWSDELSCLFQEKERG